MYHSRFGVAGVVIISDITLLGGRLKFEAGDAENSIYVAAGKGLQMRSSIRFLYLEFSQDQSDVAVDGF